MNLGKRIANIRKENKMSQDDFAEIFNVTRQTISSWENSKSYPDIETLVKISDKFNISLDILLKGDNKMIKSIDKRIKNSSIYKKILITISVIIVVIALIFVGYTINYNITKNRLETNFNKALKENNFQKNDEGYYSLKFSDEITYGVPNQKMPGLLNFSLNFHNMVIYCDFVYKNGNYMTGRWSDYNDYNFTIYSPDDIVLGSSSSLSDKDRTDITKVSEELKINKEELKLIIDKGNELYKEFYG